MMAVLSIGEWRAALHRSLMTPGLSMSLQYWIFEGR